MLVLTRKTDEKIMIGNDIEITLVRIRGGSVRIGIDAPREIRVVRGELAEAESNSEEADFDLESIGSVFADPESQSLQRKTSQKHISSKGSTPGVSNQRVGAIESALMSQPIGEPRRDAPSLFVGSVSASGAGANLKPAPLSSYVAAG